MIDDRYRKKVAQVNRHLKTLCIERNFELISHENIITEKHWNGSKIHLNKRATAILSKTFTEAISNSIYWHCFRHSLENSKVSSTVTCNEFNANKPEENTNLNFIRKGNFNRLVLAHISINSIRNKFEILIQHISNNVDILMISETKLDNSFLEGQFLIPEYSSPYRFDRNCRGGGIMLYVREDSDILINELWVMSYELISLRDAFIARVTGYFYYTSYELLFAYESRVTVYCASYDLLLMHELRVTVYCTT